MGDFINRLFTYSQLREHRLGFILSTLFMLISYGCYFLLEREWALRLALEDGLFEYLTASLFLLASFYFAKVFLKDFNWFYLALSIVFFVGCGEEISWGQRIFGFEAPDSIVNRNVQGEFNLHNLEVFHPQDGHESKQGLAKLITVDFLYNLFWFCWGIAVPLLLFFSTTLDSFASRIKFPVPALSIGLLFMANFLLMVVLRKLAMTDKTDLFYQKIREIFETNSAMIFAVLAHSFSKGKKSGR